MLGLIIISYPMSRLQLRVIRAFKSTLEDLEERRSCQSIPSLQSLRNNKVSGSSNSKTNNTSGLDDSASGGKSPADKSPACITCKASFAVEDHESESAAETDLLVPPAVSTQQAGNTTQSTCCHHHHLQQQQYYNPALSPQHFNNLVSQSIHFNMAVHSNSLEPSCPSTILPEFPKLVHETSI